MTNDFENLVQQQIQKFTTHSWREVETISALKRLEWIRTHLSEAQIRSMRTPRQVFDLLFFSYMGLQPEDLPIVSEDEDEIVWRSVNPCPTLEACRRLGLDTRQVCRDAFEKSTQVFLSQFDPQLRFLRSYSEIRPHAGYCLERIVRVDFDALMHLAIEEARSAQRAGNRPFGAVVALGSRVLARAGDTSVTQDDPGLHAEVNALRGAVDALGDSNLSGALLVSTAEPCPACTSLAEWTNLTGILYGVEIEEATRRDPLPLASGAREVSQRSPVLLEVIGGVLYDECAALYAE